MKRAVIISLTLVVGLFLTGAAYAMWGGYGSGPCITATGADVETVKKFQKETLSLRDEIMTKKLELQSEYNKPAPDTNRIAALQKEIIDLQTKIQAAAEKHGITAGGAMGGHMGGMMMGRGMMGRGMTGSGMGMMCPMWQ
ncbi:MAG: hypothetical protein QMD07_00985 [Thermodesulfovibrionales bacterium]|nr:hypothetical protein [Thermodesulfovibrionales bacterium]